MNTTFNINDPVSKNAAEKTYTFYNDNFPRIIVMITFLMYNAGLSPEEVRAYHESAFGKNDKRADHAYLIAKHIQHQQQNKTP